MSMARRTSAAAASALLVFALGATRTAAAGVPQDQVSRVTEAAPTRATAKPKRPRKLLVFNLCRGFKHGSIPLCSKTMEILGQRTGAFQAVPSTDTNMFLPENLRQFDAVLMNNTTGTLFTDERMKQGLLDFVKGGKGLVGIHAATDCFYNWKEYGEMMGGYFNAHPWNEKVGVKLDDPTHPLVAAWGGRGFEVADEIYQFKDPYSREVLRVLLSLDVEKTNMNKGNIKRKDKDFAVSWVRSYGAGRVFYCSLGHRNDIFWNPRILQHYLDGIQFALGDLEADTAAAGAGAGPGFRPLFNGKDLTGWKARPRSWVAKDGNLERKSTGDIWTEAEFGDFVLDFEFMLSRYAKSGVLIRGGGADDRKNPGIEIEIVDASRKRKPTKTDCGALYGCMAPSESVAKKAGEWNRMVITAEGSKVRVALNGKQIIDADLDDWDKLRRNPDKSFNRYPKALKDMPRSGRIGLQSKSGKVIFRNIRVKGGGGGGGGGSAELRKVDAFAGEYSGKLGLPGATDGVTARVVPQGGGNYKVVLEAGGAGGLRFELGGRAEGEKLAFSGNVEGMSLKGELAGDRLVIGAMGERFEFAPSGRRSPTLGAAPPPGAIVLLPFGKGAPSLEAWQNRNWQALPDGSMQVRKGDNRTRREFGDVQIHLEFMTPYMPDARGQKRGNSGIYIQDRYEIQVLDSFGLVSKDNDCGGIYKTAVPKVNACLPPLTWQTYDITFHAPGLGGGGNVTKPVEVTVIHNGATIHERQVVPKPTGGAVSQTPVAKAPIRLQDHGNPVRYRNIWVVELG
ncbi:MAG: family 16 glycoside hydrolase, partial [Planctomycetota bacterium]